MGHILTCKYHPIVLTRLSSFLKAGQMLRFCRNRSKLLGSEQDPVPAERRELQGTYAQGSYLLGSFYFPLVSLGFQWPRYLPFPSDKSFLTMKPSYETFTCSTSRLVDRDSTWSFAVRYKGGEVKKSGCGAQVQRTARQRGAVCSCQKCYRKRHL